MNPKGVGLVVRAIFGTLLVPRASWILVGSNPDIRVIKRIANFMIDKILF